MLEPPPHGSQGSVTRTEPGKVGIFGVVVKSHAVAQFVCEEEEHRFTAARAVVLPIIQHHLATLELPDSGIPLVPAVRPTTIWPVFGQILDHDGDARVAGDRRLPGLPTDVGGADPAPDRRRLRHQAPHVGHALEVVELLDPARVVRNHHRHRGSRTPYHRVPAFLVLLAFSKEKRQFGVFGRTEPVPGGHSEPAGQQQRSHQREQPHSP